MYQVNDLSTLPVYVHLKCVWEEGVGILNKYQVNDFSILQSNGNQQRAGTVEPKNIEVHRDWIIYFIITGVHYEWNPDTRNSSY